VKKWNNTLKDQEIAPIKRDDLSSKELLINIIFPTILSLLIYPTLFYFEKGYFSKLGIPTEYILINREQIYEFITPITTIALFIFSPVILIYILYKVKQSCFSKLLWLISPGILFTLMIYMQFDLIKDSNKYFSIFGWLAATFFFASIVATYIKPLLQTNTKGISYFVKFIKAHRIRRKKEEQSLKAFTKSLFFKYLVLLFFFPTIIYSFEKYGEKQAFEQINFDVTNIRGEKYAFITNFGGKDLLKKIVAVRNKNKDIVYEYLEEGYYKIENNGYYYCYTLKKLIPNNKGCE